MLSMCCPCLASTPAPQQYRRVSATQRDVLLDSEVPPPPTPPNPVGRHVRIDSGSSDTQRRFSAGEAPADDPSLRARDSVRGLDLGSASAVVLDNGSGFLKCGFANEAAPSVVFPSVIGREKHRRAVRRASEGGAGGDFVVGEEAIERRAVLQLSTPIDETVQNFDDVEALWSHAFSELGVSGADQPVFLTASKKDPLQRERLLQILFEAYKVPAAFVMSQELLPLFAAGRTQGIVLNSGEAATTALPVYDGMALHHAVQRVSFAGRALTDHTCRALEKYAALRCSPNAMRQIAKVGRGGEKRGERRRDIHTACVRCAVCGVWCVVCGVRCAVCCVLCAVCCVLQLMHFFSFCFDAHRKRT